ncbi:MAG: CvpA family protein [Chromatiales bacterium]|jgi:membrane protein required for colicin V production
MIWVDYLIIGIIGLSALISLVRGFMREAFSLAAWIAAFWIGWAFFRELAVRLEPWIAVPSIRLGAAFLILMVATLIVGAVVGYLVCQLVDRTGISGTDRLIGMFFGAARGALLVGILVLLAGLTAFPTDPWWRASHLIPAFQDLALWLRDWLPPDMAARFSYG